MSTIDVVARLRLNAEQFSSEAGRATADLVGNMKRAAESLPQALNSSFAEVNKLVQRSLTVPRTAGGALDLSGEIKSLTQAAAAADANAAAMRELSNAMQRTAFSATGANEAVLREADAAMIAARASDADAMANRKRAAALEEVQRELNATATATKVHGNAANDNIVRTGQQRAAMQQLSFQLNDIATQYAGGAKAGMIFAQQSGQVIQALQMLSAEGKGVLGVLGGPWGVVLTSALVVLTPFVSKLLQGNDALGDAVGKLREHAAAEEVSRQANALWSNSVDGMIEKTRSLTDELDRQLRTQDQLDQDRVRQAEQALGASYNGRGKGGEGGLNQSIEEVAAARTAVTAAREAARTATSNMKLALGMQVTAAEGKLAAAEQRVARLRADIVREERTVRAAGISILERGVANELDAAAAATSRYTAALGRLRQARETNEISAKQFQDRLSVETKRRDAAIKKAQEDARSPSIGSQITGETGARILSSAQSFVGTRENTAAGKATLSGLFGGAGISIDPEKAAWCAAFVNAVLAGQGIKGTGSLGARSFLGFGTATDKPQKGDIVVLKRGNGDMGHVGFYAGQTSNGNVLVTGGNQSDGVSTAGFARRDVLGFRRAPTASADYASEQRTAKHFEDEAMKLARVAGETVMKLQIEAGREASASFEKTADKAASDFDAMRQAQDDARKVLIDSYLTTADSLRYAASTVADLFDIRLSGPARMLIQPGGVEGRATDTANVLADSLVRNGLKISPESLTRLKDDLATVFSSASYGQIGGSVFASITGGRQSKAGSAIGGIIGGELGKVAGPAISKVVSGALGNTIGKALGSAAGPLGSLIGGALVGGVLGGLFKPKPITGAVSITGASSSSYQGSGSYAAALNGNASSVQSGLLKMADQLNATVGAFSVAIGKRGDWYHVGGDTSVDVMGKHPTGLVYEGKDESEAIRAAILNALQDGAIRGITEASARILKSGQDLDAALQKALLIEAVPRDLKTMLDPVGAAIDALNLKWMKTVDALKEGGASVEQMTQAERLHTMQIDQVKASTSSASQSLKDFMTSLKLGSSSPYSLRDQEATARAALTPYLDQIATGASIDQAKYQSAATAFLDVERQLYGSTQAYFDALDTVQASTAKAISTIDNATPITAAIPDPFTKATAESAAKTAAGVQAGNEMAEDTNAMLARIADLMSQVAQNTGGTVSGFIGADRLFTKVG